MDPLTPVWSVPRLPPGTPVGGPDLSAWWRRDGAVLTAALQVGSAAWTTDLAVEYAKHRQQFGRPIGGFQAVKHLCADMAVRAELARCAVQAAAVTVDQPDVGDPEVAAAGAKLLADEAAMTNGRSCIQVHGGMGFTWEIPAHLAYKRARVLATQFGTDDQLAESLGESLAERVGRRRHRTARSVSHRWLGHADPSTPRSPRPPTWSRSCPAGAPSSASSCPSSPSRPSTSSPGRPAAGPDELAQVALACEAAGFFYVGVCDHTFIPERLAGAMSTIWYDTIATLGWLAGVTTEIRLLSHIYVVALRHPLRAAKEFATVDALSHGRVICGVGAGHVVEEFEHDGTGLRPPWTGHRRGHRRAGRGVERGVPGAGRSPLEGDRPRSEAAPGAGPPTTHLGGRIVARCAAPHGPVRRRLAPPVARPQPGPAGRAPADARGVPGRCPARHRGDLRRRSTSVPQTARSELPPGTVSGSPEQVAEYLRPFRDAGVGQSRCAFPPDRWRSCVDQVAAFGSDVAPLVDG